MAINKHPFAVEAFFQKSVVLTFAIPKEQLQSLLPEPLELDIYNETHGFVAIAMVDTKGLRVKGSPKFLGNDFFLIGYRIFVRYTNNRGKRLRGLYILKSETNKKKMQFFGNIFTQYQYTTTDISMTSEGNGFCISSEASQFKVNFEEGENEIALPKNSPFPDWKTARRYAGPLPFTFTYNTEKKEMVIIEGVRANWKPKAIAVADYEFDFLKKPAFNNAILANAFVINNIPYWWKKGAIETWNG